MGVTGVLLHMAGASVVGGIAGLLLGVWSIKKWGKRCE
jgi:hypothetical protein